MEEKNAFRVASGKKNAFWLWKFPQKTGGFGCNAEKITIGKKICILAV